jgi:hypothetical protein
MSITLAAALLAIFAPPHLLADGPRIDETGTLEIREDGTGTLSREVTYSGFLSELRATDTDDVRARVEAQLAENGARDVTVRADFYDDTLMLALAYDVTLTKIAGDDRQTVTVALEDPLLIDAAFGVTYPLSVSVARTVRVEVPGRIVNVDHVDEHLAGSAS